MKSFGIAKPITGDNAFSGIYQCTATQGTLIACTLVCQNLFVGYVLKYIFRLILESRGFFVWIYLGWNISIKVLKCFILCWDQYLGEKSKLGGVGVMTIRAIFFLTSKNLRESGDGGKTNLQHQNAMGSF